MLGNNLARAVQPHSSETTPGELWTIGDMARRYGLSLRALRFYEDRGLIRPLRHGTARLYDSRCRARLEKVLKAKRLGFTLGRIYQMMPRIEAEDSDIEQALAPSEIAAQIASLERQKSELDGAIAALRAAHEKLAAQNSARAG
jgi:DNA-binding transcriptional MerR regulator